MDKPSTDVVDKWLRLRHSTAMSSRVAARLIRHLGEPGVARGTSPSTLDRLIGTYPANMFSRCDKRAVDTDRRWLDARTDHRIIVWDDPDYPALLKEIPDPPLLLYAIGERHLLSQPQIAIVGSRNPTPNGVATARELAQDLGDQGIVVTSGLAIGIDAAAHRGALSGGAGTVAVAATGVDQVYPRRHRELAHDIGRRGMIVSEFPIGTAPRKSHFPQRNRLISGLCLGTLVVEAAIRSGSLITARFAAEQGREVYAVPGSIRCPVARGCHQLIRDGAKLVESVTDIVEELGQFLPSPDAANTIPRGGVENVEFANILSVMGYDPVTVEVLVQRSGLTADTVSSMLLCMELDGVVETLNTGEYIRTR